MIHTLAAAAAAAVLMLFHELKIKEPRHHRCKMEIKHSRELRERDRAEACSIQFNLFAIEIYMHCTSNSFSMLNAKLFNKRL